MVLNHSSGLRIGWVAAAWWGCLMAAAGGSFSLHAAASGRLNPSRFVRIAQSSDASPTNTASRAMDGAVATFSLTADQEGSFWTAELGRSYPLESIEIVNRAAPKDAEMDGLTLRLFDLDDQVVFETALSNPGPGGTLVVSLPAGLRARTMWVGLLAGQLNGGGNHRVGIVEARMFGGLAIPNGPEPISAPFDTIKVYQSSNYGPAFTATNAVDRNASSFSQTADLADSFWMTDLGKPTSLARVELVNRADCCAARMTGLVLRVFDGASNSVFSATLPATSLGTRWATNLPAGTSGRYLRVGLEDGAKNGDGNYFVSLAEARVYSGAVNLFVGGTASAPAAPNLASLKPSYMIRLTESIASASNANDNNVSTETRTTMQTVDGYWEVDMGRTYALYGVRAFAASGIGTRMTNCFLRLFDEGHNSVFAQKLSGVPDVFDTDLNGPVFARFARIGLENKQRTDPAGGLEWYIGLREAQVFGTETNGVGILSFVASDTQVADGQPVTLSWNVDQVKRVEIHPGTGSVGTQTAASGAGSIALRPAQATEYLLIASNAAGLFIRAVGVETASSRLTPRISEIVAGNKLSLTDGYGNSPDWIELRNPGNAAVDLAGHGLSDDPLKPMKWVFPSVKIDAHGMLIVFASGQKTPFDPAGFLHASFQLKQGGGALVLTGPDRVTVDALASYPALDTDLAYARDLEGNWAFMEPTPGAANIGKSYLGWLSPLTFSHARGFYEAPFTLTITNDNAGASVFYSLDGSVPTVPYTTGIPVAGAKAIRAEARRAGYRTPRIQTATYVFINNVITSAVMRTTITKSTNYAARMRPGLLALPSISIVAPSKPDYVEQEGSVEVLWPNGTPAAQANCGISIFGGSWQRFPKDSFTVKCRASYGATKLRTPLFDGFDHGVKPKTSFDKLELRAGDQDMVDRGFYMSGRFVEDSMMDMGDLNPHGRFVHVYLNGVYWGEYDAREPLMEHFLASYLGGSSSDYVSVKGNDNVGDDFVVGAPDPPNVQPWQKVFSLRSSYAAVRPYLDVPGMIDFMLLWFYGDCESEFRACGPLTAGTGFKFWEADADGFLRTDALGLNRTANVGPGGIFGALVREGNSDFKTLIADRVYRHFFNGGALTPARNDARLAARMLEIHDSLLAECARWGFRTPANWESSAATIRSQLFPKRTTELVTMLRGTGLYPKVDPPSFNGYGGWVTEGFRPQLSSVSGTIYYTLDGSDPRLPGGAVSPQAVVWSPGALSLTSDTILNARVRSPTGQWSALAEPRYRVAPPLTLRAQIEGGTLRMTFAGVVGETYRAEMADSLNSPTWQLLQEIKPATASPIQVVDPELLQKGRFYRVRWVQ